MCRLYTIWVVILNKPTQFNAKLYRFYSIVEDLFSQSSVASFTRCGGWVSCEFEVSSLSYTMQQELLKFLKCCQSYYGRKHLGCFFYWDAVYVDQRFGWKLSSNEAARWWSGWCTEPVSALQQLNLTAHSFVASSFCKMLLSPLLLVHLFIACTVLCHTLFSLFLLGLSFLR